MRKRNRYRHGNGKKKTLDSYLIILLICLIIFNAGALLVRYYSVKLDFGKIQTVFSNLNFISKISEGKDNNDPEIISSPVDIEDELIISNDYIIDRLDEYESLIIIKDNMGIGSIENIPQPLNIKKVSLDKEKDYIFIYHTHATESFLTEARGVYHNQDTEKNIVSIGGILETVLEANGHRVDHSKILHDQPSYNQSYSRSLKTINQKKEENNNLKIFFDIHRDGVAENAAYKDKFLQKARVDINGVSTATFSLVVGPDTPNYESVLSFAKYIKAVSDTVYPGLCTGIIIKEYGKYNLYSSDYAALVEVGSNLVTHEEAKESAKLIGEVLSLVINSIVE